ncbi:hypothetical protein X943_002115 [Babesia divergens]|uniref:Uncharacterized protein n=1 Tax=Babesia divergens TaxID=32595 RepID=A0AAD9GDE1_BABDI|nr:hypothetical protein X943_002115 [Babesia divergens]
MSTQSLNSLKATGTTGLLETSDEKSLSISYGRGLRLTDRNLLPAEVSNDDYNIALTNVYHDYDALFTLLQRLRFEKLCKLTSHDGWNPFDFQHVNVCTPIPVGDIENYGYDEQTSSCRCPSKLLPCTLNHALSDHGFWTSELRRLATESKFTRRYDRLKLATRYLNIINTKGVLIQETAADSISTKRRQICNAVDAVLCSVTDTSRANTQWSPWGGCSERCDTGTQERFRITYTSGAKKFITDKRMCELTKCSDYNQHADPQCSIFTIPPAEQENVIVRTCACPTEGSVLCSSHEASITMPTWLPQFREYCKKSLSSNDSNNILYKDIPQLKSRYLGRFIQIRFRDGYYFDCAERWGMLDKDDTTSYCKVGSPVLCREPLGKDTSQVAPLRATDVDFIDIHFRDSLFDVTYNIYGKRINSIWLCGTIVSYSTDYEKGLFTFDDDSGRILQIKFTTTIFYSQPFGKNTIEVTTIGRLVSILCGISHVIVEEDALLCLKV